MSNKEESKFKCTYADIEIYHNVLQGRGPQRGALLKDLRLLNTLRQTIAKSVAPRMNPPDMPKPANGEKYTPEEAKANQEIYVKWQQDLDDLMATEVELDLSNLQVATMKQWMQSASFAQDPKRTELVLHASEALGLTT